MQGVSVQSTVDSYGVLRFNYRFCVPRVGALIQLILSKAHDSKDFIHPATTKMYRDLSQHYWWDGMKMDIAAYISCYLSCQQVKAQHQKPCGVLQRLPIL